MRSSTARRSTSNPLDFKKQIADSAPLPGLRGTFPWQTCSRSLSGGRLGCLLSTGGAFLRRHVLRGSLAAQFAIRLPELAEVIGDFPGHSHHREEHSAYQG